MSFLFALSEISEIDMSKFLTKNVKDMSYMFYGCASLVLINMKN